ncbi:MAG: MBL fold metallo-hydrolase [Christensenellaceae bacterium]|nr:MBL fold metallo-hydrolase [Christensenellaceae bacterium]
MRITPNVYLLSGFAYGLHPNAYGVTIPGDEEHMILIDTGLAEPDRMMIEKNRAYWGLDKRKISHVLLTHSHFDHSGNALYYYEQGAKIVMSEADAIAVSSGNSRTIDYAYAEKFPACPVDIRVKDGDVLDIFGLKIRCFAVPGHTEGSMFFEVELDGKDILFAGDSVQSEINCEGAKLCWTGAEDYDKEKYIASLGRAAKTLRPDILLGGHYQPALHEGYRVLCNAYALAISTLR